MGVYAGGEKGSLVNLIMRMAHGTNFLLVKYIVNFLHKYAFDNSKTRESVVIEIQSSRNVSRTEVVVRAHFQVSVSLHTFAVRKGQKTGNSNFILCNVSVFTVFYDSFK